MTNIEVKQANAVKALEAGVLNSYETEFVEETRNLTKKELRDLTSKQYDLLRKCADKA